MARKMIIQTVIGLTVIWLAALVSRIAFALWAPMMTFDSQIYATIAANIIYNHCVSLSVPETAACVPDWGGNSLPGYPLFIAVFQLIFRQAALLPILVGQGAVFAASVTYFVWSLQRIGSGRVAFVAGLVIAVSPLTVAWNRFLLTETLSVAVTIWVWAELIRSLTQHRLRVMPLAAAIIIGSFIRIDLILLCVPVSIIGLAIHRPFAAIRRGLILAVIIALPLGGWWYRSVSEGLPNLPPMKTAQGITRSNGLFNYVGLLRHNEVDLAMMVWPVLSGHYSQIRIDDSQFKTPEEREAIRNLLRQVAAYDGATIPTDIDTKFQEIASRRAAAESPFTLNYLEPIRATLWMWFTLQPLLNSGWPEGGAYEARLELATSLYRIALIGFTVVAGIGVLFPGHWYRSLSLAVFSLIIARSIMLANIGAVENRYLITLFPGMETIAVLTMATFGARCWRVLSPNRD